MNEDRLQNLYEHSGLSIFELKAQRLLILKGKSDYSREEAGKRVAALNNIIRQKEGLLA